MTTTTQITTLSGIEFQLSELRSKYNKAVGQKEMLEQQLKNTDTALQQTRQDVALWRDVQVLFGKVSEFARAQLKARIEETVSAALQAVFERDDIRFEIEIKPFGQTQPLASSEYVWRYVCCRRPKSSRRWSERRCSPALRLALLVVEAQVEGPVLLDEVAAHSLSMPE